MRKRIYWSLCLVSLAALICSTVASLSLYYRFYSEQIQADLKSQCYALAAGILQCEDPVDFLSEVQGVQARITLLDETGDALFDSQSDEGKMEEHSDRAEFKQALRQGYGEDFRRSDTMGKNSYYYAVRIDEKDVVLRLAQDTHSIFSVFMRIFPSDLLSCILLFCLSIWVARVVTRRIVAPLNETAGRLDEGGVDTAYPELTPFLDKIHKQNQTIRAQLESIQEDRDTLSMILENMQEGMIILGQEKKVLSINQSAIEFLEISSPQPVGAPFVCLCRKTPLLQAVSNAQMGEASSGIVELEGKQCRYFASPVKSGGNIGGVILLLMDVTEQVKAQRAREEFSANVSHELKTPLTTISGFAEMMKDGMVKRDAEVQEFSGMIYTQAQRLLTLIDDIIRLSRIEEGKDIMNEFINLEQTVQMVVSELKPEAERRQVTIETKTIPCGVKGNATMLREMVFNLLENAVKYNVPSGSVKITVQKGAAGTEFIIQDTGIGIPKEHIGRIFERFYRVDKSRSKQTGGTGLGLSIVKHIVEKHQAKLDISSEVGKGTTIRVCFPQ